MGKDKKKADSLTKVIDYSSPEMKEKFDRLAKEAEEERERLRTAEESERKAREEADAKKRIEDAKILYRNKPRQKTVMDIRKQLVEHAEEIAELDEEERAPPVEKEDIQTLAEEVRRLNGEIAKLQISLKVLSLRLKKIKRFTSTKLAEKDLALITELRCDLIGILNDASIYRVHKQKVNEKYRKGR